MSQEDKTNNDTDDDSIDSPKVNGGSKAVDDDKLNKSINKNTQADSAFYLRLKTWYFTKKIISIPLTVIILFCVFALIPATRAYTAGLVIKKDVEVSVVDSKTQSVVSSASVQMSGQSVPTNGQGIATIKNVAVGRHEITVIKKYYKDAVKNVSVGFGNPQKFTIQAEATGRSTMIKVANLINHKALAEAKLSLGDITAKTDANGEAIVVLPVGTKSKQASLSLDGYNTTNVVVNVSDKEVAVNNYTLTPRGKVYYLSKLSGRIDLVKTNLDGSERETIFAGTGREDDIGTVLLASRNWKYLALLSRHDSDLPKLYLIETANDKVTTIDEGNASFSMVGWDGDSFVYQVTRNTYNDWQSKKNALKSFNAESKQLIVLDQTDASGNSGQYIQEQLGNIYNLADGSVIYTKTWYGYPYDNPGNLSSKQNGIYSIRSDGSSKKTLKAIPAGTASYITATPSKPSEVYYYYYTNDSSEPAYAEYKDGSIKTIQASEFPDNGIYNTYLISPNGQKTFWSEQRDGKNTLFVGDTDGGNGKVVAELSDYQTYGWFTEDYLLLSKNGSELFIMPAQGVDQSQQPVKISDYHKPAQNYYGYGGGYGGI